MQTAQQAPWTDNLLHRKPDMCLNTCFYMPERHMCLNMCIYMVFFYTSFYMAFYMVFYMQLLLRINEIRILIHTNCCE